MLVEFKRGIDVLRDRGSVLRLTTGDADLDSLLGGGIEPGHFYLFYGSGGSGVDLLVHRVLVTCLLPVERYGFDGRPVYFNCGNYRGEKTLLDSHLLTFLIKAARLDPMKALNDIYVACAFSEEQQEQMVSEVQRLIEEDEEVKLVVVHDIAKLFTSNPTKFGKGFTERITRLQRIVLRLWQSCARNNVAFVASCRPNEPSRGIPLPEGGKYLRHEANVIVYLRKRGGKTPFVTAHLMKHPNRAPRRADFPLKAGGDAMGMTNAPFRTLLQEEMNGLKRGYREALMDASRRDAFDKLLRACISEQGAMSHAETTTVLDVMLLMGLVDNRKLVEELYDRLGFLESRIEKLNVVL